MKGDDRIAPVLREIVGDIPRPKRNKAVEELAQTLSGEDPERAFEQGVWMSRSNRERLV